MELVATIEPQPLNRTKRLNLFERYLTVWVGLCMVAGVLLGKVAPGLIQVLRDLEFGQNSHVNLPMAILIWLMITPMMMKVDFRAVAKVGQRPQGLFVTLFINWVVKPFSMAFLAWVFFRFMFSAWMTPAEADQYIAGAIILAAAPCTAMVFVWSYLTDGDPAYTLVQVSVNDLIMLVLFAPIVGLLVSGASSLTVPFAVLLYSVVGFIVIPLVLESLLRHWFIRQRGKTWFEETLLPAVCSRHHRGAAHDLGPHFCLPSGQHSRQTLARPAHCDSDSLTSLFQCLARLWADEMVESALCRRRAGGADWSEQLL